MEIRKGTIKDLKAIQKLNLGLFEKEFKEYDPTLNCKWTFGKSGTDYFKQRLKDNKDSFVSVAEHNKEIVGYFIGALSKPESYRIIPKFAEGENMFILKEHRNKGIGSKMIQEFLTWCKEKQVKRIKFVASAQNKKAIDLYQKLGFKKYSITLEKEI